MDMEPEGPSQALAAETVPSSPLAPTWSQGTLAALPGREGGLCLAQNGRAPCLLAPSRPLGWLLSAITYHLPTSASW